MLAVGPFTHAAGSVCFEFVVTIALASSLSAGGEGQWGGHFQAYNSY